MSEVKNTVCWVDIPVQDLDRAITFYAKVFGQSVQKVTEHGFEFALLPHNDNNVSGCLVKDGRAPSENGALIYLNVDGFIDEATTAAAANGGAVIDPKKVMGPYGQRALIRDTEGNVIALYAK